MQYITTTSLRNESAQVVSMLKGGTTLSLVHRSRVIGVLQPAAPAAVVMDAKAFYKIPSAIPLEKRVPRSMREKIYRKHLMEKYGKSIS